MMEVLRIANCGVRIVALSTVYCLLSTDLRAVDSTINVATNQQSSYGANIGWMNWRANTTNGVVFGEFFCSGSIYAGNVGWISLGNGTPTNGVRYTNLSTNDFGVNHDGAGNLRGFGYSANAGWLIFTNRDVTGTVYDAPKVDLVTGDFSGFVYGANIGWVKLNDAAGFVKTDIMFLVDTDGDGIADQWELLHAGNLLAMNAGTDSDGDGALDAEEYTSDTNPFDASELLRITTIAVDATGADTDLTWTSRPTRLYRVQKRLEMTSGDWLPSDPPGLVLPNAGTLTSSMIADTPATNRFFRVRALRPLTP